MTTATSPNTRPAADAAGPDPRRWLGLCVIAVAQLMVVLDASIVNIALPSAQRDLGISDGDRQWVVTAYTLAFGGLLLLGGRIADYLGRKRVFIVGLLGFAAASALGGAAPDAALLFAARALQGAFAAILAPAALSLITVTFTEGKERARAFGVYGAIAGGGAAIGLILGGILTEYASWRWCLLVNVPIALLTAAAAVVVLTDSRSSDTQRRYDVPGALLVTGGLVALVYGFTKAAEVGVGWSAPVTLALLAVAVVLLVGFVVLERRTTFPLLPLRVPLDRNRGGSYLAAMLVGGGLFAMFLFLTYYLQGTLGYSPLRSGFAFLPFSAGIIVAAGLSSQLLPRVGPKRLMIGGLSLATTGLLYLTQIGVHTSYVTHVLPAILLMSIGMGLSFVPLSSTALSGVEPRDAGVASALVNTSQQVGGSLGTALLNTLYATAVTHYVVAHHGAGAPTRALLRAAPVHGFGVAFSWGALFLLLAVVIVAGLLRGGREAVTSTEDVVHLG